MAGVETFTIMKPRRCVIIIVPCNQLSVCFWRCPTSEHHRMQVEKSRANSPCAMPKMWSMVVCVRKTMWLVPRASIEEQEQRSCLFQVFQIDTRPHVCLRRLLATSLFECVKIWPVHLGHVWPRGEKDVTTLSLGLLAPSFMNPFFMTFDNLIQGFPVGQDFSRSFATFLTDLIWSRVRCWFRKVRTDAIEEVRWIAPVYIAKGSVIVTNSLFTEGIKSVRSIRSSHSDKYREVEQYCDAKRDQGAMLIEKSRRVCSVTWYT